MPTNSSTLQLRLTGAASYEAAQSDPDASLGDYMAADRYSSRGWQIVSEMHTNLDSNALPNLQIVDVAGKTPSGLATLRAATTGALKLKCYGETAWGSAVAVANGETKVIYGANTDYWVEVNRTSASDLEGDQTFLVEDHYNVLFNNWANAARVAGAAKYRALAVKVRAAQSAAALYAYSTAESAEVQLAWEEPSAQPNGVFTTHSDEDDDAGLSYSSAAPASPLAAPVNLAAGEELALHVKSIIQPAAAASASELLAVELKHVGDDGEGWGDGGWGSMPWGGDFDWRKQPIRDRFRIEDTTLDDYGLWIGVDAAPDLTASADETFDALPYTPSYVWAPSHTYHLVVRQRNEYGLWDRHVGEWLLEVDALGDQVPTPPSDPVIIDISAGPAGSVDVEVEYHRLLDLSANRADSWALWYTDDGSVPDPDNDPADYEEAMTWYDDVAHFVHRLDGTGDLPGPWLEGTTVKLILRARRSATPDVDSENATITTITATLLGPAAPTPAAAHLGAISQEGLQS